MENALESSTVLQLVGRKTPVAKRQRPSNEMDMSEPEQSSQVDQKQRTRTYKVDLTLSEVSDDDTSYLNDTKEGDDEPPNARFGHASADHSECDDAPDCKKSRAREPGSDDASAAPDRPVSGAGDDAFVEEASDLNRSDAEVARVSDCQKSSAEDSTRARQPKHADSGQLRSERSDVSAAAGRPVSGAGAVSGDSNSHAGVSGDVEMSAPAVPPGVVQSESQSSTQSVSTLYCMDFFCYRDRGC